MMSLPAMTNQSASHRGIANQIDTTTRFCNAQVIKNMSGAGPLRNRPFAIHGPGLLQPRAAVCRIPCLILCLAYVERTSMARRTVLTSRQRLARFSLPPREAELRRHDTGRPTRRSGRCCISYVPHAEYEGQYYTQATVA